MSAISLIVFTIFIWISYCRSYSRDVRTEEMVRLSEQGPLIKFDRFMFKKYVSTTKKNYTVVLLLTALDASRSCENCRTLYNDMIIVSNSWKKSPHHKSDLFFGYADFDSRGSEIFKLLKITNVPILLIFDKGHASPMDIKQPGSPAQIAKIISSIYPLKIHIIEPIDYPLLVVITVFVLLISYTYFNFNDVFMELVDIVWKHVSLTFISLMVSGYMWNTMHPSSLVWSSDSVIHPQRRQQYLLETIIIFFTIGGCSAALVVLAKAVEFKSKIISKKVISLAGLLTFVGFFTVYVNLARKKMFYPSGMIFDFVSWF